MNLVKAMREYDAGRIVPITTRYEINDKITRTIFNLNDEEYEDVLENGTEIVEARTKKHGEVCSNVQLQHTIARQTRTPLNEFDRAVLSVCISNYAVGNRCISYAMIYRGLTGKVKKSSNARPSSECEKEIRKSVNKLMSTLFMADVEEAFEKLKYVGGTAIAMGTSAILPCCTLRTLINGNDTEVVWFDRDSPLLAIADIKKQIIRYDCELLDIPNQQNTLMNITVKNYLLRRVSEIKAHKLMPSITFRDLYLKCRIPETPSYRQRARMFAQEFLKHLHTHKYIEGFGMVKVNGTRQVHSITIVA